MSPTSRTASTSGRNATITRDSAGDLAWCSASVRTAHVTGVLYFSSIRPIFQTATAIAQATRNRPTTM